MELTKLWDIQILFYGLTSTAVVVFVLIILAIMNRRVRTLTSEMESVQREIRMLDDGIRTVIASLKNRGELLAQEAAEKAEAAGKPQIG